jgi:hypothetical protein
VFADVQDMVMGRFEPRGFAIVHEMSVAPQHSFAASTFLPVIAVWPDGQSAEWGDFASLGF